MLQTLDSHAVSVSEPDGYLVSIEESSAKEWLSVGNQDFCIAIYSIPNHYGRMDDQADGAAIREVSTDIAAEW